MGAATPAPRGSTAAAPPIATGGPEAAGATIAQGGPDASAARSLSPLTALLRELGDFDPAEIQRWLQLLGFARVAAPPATRVAPNDLGALLHRMLRPAGNLAATGSAVAAAGEDGARGGETARGAGRPPTWLQEGLRLVEQALGQNLLQRVTVGLQTEAQQPQLLSLALPFLDAGQVKPLAIEIEQQGRRDSDQEARWEVRLRFELAGLGPVCCYLSLQGARVGARFFSREDATRAAIETALPDLRHQLDRAGFVADELYSHTGEAPPETSNRDRLPVDSVIDLKA